MDYMYILFIIIIIIIIKKKKNINNNKNNKNNKNNNRLHQHFLQGYGEMFALGLGPFPFGVA